MVIETVVYEAEVAEISIEKVMMLNWAEEGKGSVKREKNVIIKEINVCRWH